LPIELLKHLIDFFQVPFWPVQEARNEYQIPFDHLKHIFPEFINVAFLGRSEA